HLPEDAPLYLGGMYLDLRELEVMRRQEILADNAELHVVARSPAQPGVQSRIGRHGSLSERSDVVRRGIPFQVVRKAECGSKLDLMLGRESRRVRGGNVAAGRIE